MKTIGFIGGGQMATAIISGMIKSGNYLPEQIYVTDLSSERLDFLAKQLAVNTCFDHFDLLKQVDVLVLAVKPHVYPEVIAEIKEQVRDILIITIAAGITLNFLEKSFLQGQRIIRTMPNLPAVVLAGTTSLVKGKLATEEDMDVVKNIFSSIGSVFIIAEEYINIATALTGSSPAMIAMLVEAMADGAVLNGMPRKLAYEYAINGVIGSAKLLQHSEEHVAEWKDRVASPAGTTIEMIASLEKDAFRSSVIKAMDCCIKKANQF